jgi:hypothetical protein
MPLPEPDSFSATSTADPGEDAGLRRYRWYHKFAGVMAAIFCFEVGVFLLVYPWASEWDVNYSAFLPFWARNVWASPYFRGAVSGLGILNIYISFVEVFRLRRFSA